MYLYLSLVNAIEAALRKEEGQDLVEYALIIALIAILLVAALGALRGGISTVFSQIVSSFAGGT
jgi:pilus assembly protein Flp/PilA